MMGADSVAYHRDTVLHRFDDHPGQALAYYAARGETPLRWGGAGAMALGLVANVTDAKYEAIYGPGGAVDPHDRRAVGLDQAPRHGVGHRRPQVRGRAGGDRRAEHMHRIMDAERDATLAYLDALTAHQGGRRGRACVSSPTVGLVYAVTRHATSRAGDPAPHDHVLLANVVRMADDKGGWKAATPSLWRDHLHAATMFGRVAAAREAVTLGYGITPDDGPSGRLEHWAIAGIPVEVMEVHSKRAAEITAELNGAVRGELAYDGEPGNEHPGRDQDSIVGPAGNQLWQVVEDRGEVVDDPDELEDLEVMCRGMAVTATLRRELSVEVLEEAGGCANDPSRFAHRSCVSVSAIRCRARCRTRSRKSGGTLAGSGIRLAWKSSSWSAGVRTSSSAAVQTLSAMPTIVSASSLHLAHTGVGRLASGGPLSLCPRRVLGLV